MNDERSYGDYLGDMLDMAQAVQAFVAGMSYDEFLADLKTQLAVTRALEIMGEAAKHIPPEHTVC
ncbi:MAG: HepT-like ribonuclease domain-containing protein [Anaerolineae bacterium]